MKFLHILLPLTALTSLVASQATIIRGVLTTIQAEAAELRTAFDTEDPVLIQAAGEDLLVAIDQGIIAVEASRPLSLLETLGFANQILTLQTEVGATADAAIAKKSVAETYGLVDEVREAFTEGRASVAVLGQVLLTKVPTTLHPLATDLLNSVDAAFAEVIEAYSA